MMTTNWATTDVGTRLVDFSSETDGCEAENVLDPRLNSIWLSAEGLPQWFCLSLGAVENVRDIVIRTIGWHCWHPYSTNPKVVTLHVSPDGAKFKQWDTFRISAPKKGTQLFCCAPISSTLYPFLAFEVTEVFGGNQTYMNRLFLYSDEVASSPQVSDNSIRSTEVSLDVASSELSGANPDSIATASLLHKLEHALGLDVSVEQEINDIKISQNLPEQNRSSSAGIQLDHAEEIMQDMHNGNVTHDIIEVSRQNTSTTESVDTLVALEESHRYHSRGGHVRLEHDSGKSAEERERNISTEPHMINKAIDNSHPQSSVSRDRDISLPTSRRELINERVDASQESKTYEPSRQVPNSIPRKPAASVPSQLPTEIKSTSSRGNTPSTTPVTPRPAASRNMHSSIKETSKHSGEEVGDRVRDLEAKMNALLNAFQTFQRMPPPPTPAAPISFSVQAPRDEVELDDGEGSDSDSIPVTQTIGSNYRPLVNRTQVSPSKMRKDIPTHTPGRDYASESLPPSRRDKQECSRDGQQYSRSSRRNSADRELKVAADREGGKGKCVCRTKHCCCCHRFGDSEDESEELSVDAIRTVQGLERTLRLLMKSSSISNKQQSNATQESDFDDDRTRSPCSRCIKNSPNHPCGSRIGDCREVVGYCTCSRNFDTSRWEMNKCPTSACSSGKGPGGVFRPGKAFCPTIATFDPCRNSKGVSVPAPKLAESIQLRSPSNGVGKAASRYDHRADDDDLCTIVEKLHEKVLEKTMKEAELKLIRKFKQRQANAI